MTGESEGRMCVDRVGAVRVEKSMAQSQNLLSRKLKNQSLPDSRARPA